MKNKRGFTLVELLAVIAIIALISLIAIPNIVGLSTSVKKDQMLDDAKKLAETMVAIGRNLGKDVKAEITDMDQPLGMAVGNSLEIKEVISTLHNQGPSDLTEICLSSGSILLVQSKLFKTENEAREALIENLKNGKAFQKFREFVIAQGGDVSYVDHPEKFEVAKHIIEIKSTKSSIYNWTAKIMLL